MSYKQAGVKSKTQKLRRVPETDITSPESDVKLPHERDETTDSRTKPRKVMKQALRDLQAGMLDTDLHGERGVEVVFKPKAKSIRKH
ncbi:MAG: hypothetical protein HY254_07990 [Burkholderiales bacterium]|nr:hypothetical protein [Burkholderiales bacterium]